jgi:hypothetical protein
MPNEKMYVERKNAGVLFVSKGFRGIQCNRTFCRSCCSVSDDCRISNAEGNKSNMISKILPLLLMLRTILVIR